MLNIGIHTLSFGFGMLGMPGLYITSLLARKLGVGVQLMPQRGIVESVDFFPPEQVLAIEWQPWNYGPLSQVYKRLKAKNISPGFEPPMPIDWFLFGSSEGDISIKQLILQSNFPDVLYVSHSTHCSELEGFVNWAFELHPDAFIKERRPVFDVQTEGIPLVLDYTHLTRTDRYGHGVRVFDDDPVDWLMSLPIDLVKGVHFHPRNAQDINDFLSNKGTQFDLFHRILFERLKSVASHEPVIIENHPKHAFLVPKLISTLMKL